MEAFPTLDELRRMTVSQLEKVAEQLRAFIPATTKEKKGHLESSLTVTELTVALHHVFRTPEDILIWDVGHQAYVHKVITDRATEFHTNRQLGGISGFPNRSESPFDAFGTGHSSTSISAITGMAFEAHRKGLDIKHVAVIGDGALTGGMAYEGLNYLGQTDLDVLVLLNDNRKAIDPNVGALHESDSYEMFFQSLGIRWMGHVNGSNMDELVHRLWEGKEATGPRVLHIETQSEILPSEGPNYSSEHPFQDVFGEAILEKLESDPDLVVLSPAMLSGSGLAKARQLYPERVLDVAIAEQHAATMAAGIAAAGGKVLLHLYSTFAQRAYDQIIHDIALQNLPVTLAIDRAGLVGNDGATHHGAFDLAFLRPIPNITITAPRNGIELRNAVHTGLNHNGPFVIRYPRDTEAKFDAEGRFETLEYGRSQWLKEGSMLCLMATGTMSRRALEVATILSKKGYEIGVLHHLFVKPLDEEALMQAASYNHWVVLEDSSAGGLGSAISEWLSGRDAVNVDLDAIHLPDEFIEHGSVDELHRQLGMDVKSVAKRCKNLLSGI